MPQVFAHRGYSAIAPENTLAAFEKAILAGADGIELDVHLTHDGELVVLHDETMDRTTTGSGWVRDLTLAKIKQWSAGAWFSPSYSNEQVPTLREVLELVVDTPLFLNIELKNNVVTYPKLEEKVVALVEHFAMQERVILSSFNHFSLRHLHRYRPDWQLGALYECGLYQPWIYARHLGVSAIHPFFLAATDKVIKGCHAHGIQVRPYTVDNPADWQRLIDVDAIITNVPGHLHQFLSRN